jgi:hypothetical protein
MALGGGVGQWSFVWRMGVVSTNLAPCFVWERQTAFEFGLIDLYDDPQRPVCQMVGLETVL